MMPLDLETCFRHSFTSREGERITLELTYWLEQSEQGHVERRRMYLSLGSNPPVQSFEIPMASWGPLLRIIEEGRL